MSAEWVIGSDSPVSVSGHWWLQVCRWEGSTISWGMASLNCQVQGLYAHRSSAHLHHLCSPSKDYVAFSWPRAVCEVHLHSACVTPTLVLLHTSSVDLRPQHAHLSQA
jgi:hypothetical protein